MYWNIVMHIIPCHWANYKTKNSKVEEIEIWFLFGRLSLFFSFLSFFFFFLLFFFFLRATPKANVGSQARGLMAAAAAGLCTATVMWDWSCVCDLQYSSWQLPTHWARPGIMLVSSWILVRFITTEPQRELQAFPFWLLFEKFVPFLKTLIPGKHLR